MKDESITCEICGQTFIGMNGLTEWTFHRALKHATENKSSTAIADGEYWHIVHMKKSEERGIED
tara:strand:+ start:458 stop:649 length:192 start_codon:yes stop_codon:yes gene_type:complete